MHGSVIESDDADAVPFWWRLVSHGLDPSPRAQVLKEMERLSLGYQESFDELRRRLVTYKAGDLWFPAGGLERKDTDIPPLITILLLGFKGSGKTSLINFMYTALGILPFPQASTLVGIGRSDGPTHFLEEHNVLRSMRNGFCVFDSRGLEYDRLIDGLDQVSEWMEQGIRHCQLCRRGSGKIIEPSTTSSKAVKRFVRRVVNCVMVVVSVSEMYRSMAEGDFGPLQATRELFHAPAINTVCSKLLRIASNYTNS